jgi:KDO2-lipid IV(A) lauroyltransferase
MLKKLLKGGEFLIVLLLASPLALLPYGLSRRAGRALGLLVYHLIPTRRIIAVRNLRESIEKGALRLDASPEETAKEFFKNLGQSVSELAKIYFGLGGGIFKSVSVKGFENYEKAKTPGRGIIFVTAHAGNWELLALYSPQRFLEKLYVVARPLDNPYLNRFIEGMRARYGNEIVYKSGALRRLLRLLKAGGMTGILMDQAVLPDEGRIIEFLGRGAWTTRMPLLLARRTGAALLPVFISRAGSGGRHEITIHPEVDLNGTEEEVLRRINAVIEEHVKAHPSEWLWLHRRWKRVPE